jgi:glutamine synthetase
MTAGTDIDLEAWLRERRVTEVECILPDMSGIARGKILPTRKFLETIGENTLRVPESIFGQTVTGSYIESTTLDITEPDVILKPDSGSIRVVPWYSEPTAQVICDAFYSDGTPVALSPRGVLRKVVDLYAARGWRPVVAPELEFYLAAKNVDPDYPLEPPIGASGRPETGRQSYGIDAVNEFDPLFEDMYDYCEAQEIDIDTLIHESGAAQVEINFNHGDPMELADQAFLFKRTVRQTAVRKGLYATFMAKPYEGEPGSAMHLHQSVVGIATGDNLFSDAAGANTDLFRFHIGGLQQYLAGAMLMIAPNVNSYRRIIKDDGAPINTHWGEENRTVGLRIPNSVPSGRRLENRVPGADANPYLAIAASLACGYLGMINELEPTAPMTGNAYESKRHVLPRHMLDAIAKFEKAKDLQEIVGRAFTAVFVEVKQEEHNAYQQVVSAWEREHLLLNV